ncbi:hypothetical protein ACE7GA_15460 [Roseomonas sp. CCTCC AB2023176]|uniref:hypothetical protein n=1 Tax=Roseomonas sp. CCTCC AB2023176 TaxID=3342640 RepID=UPI0035E35FD7
MPFHQECPGGFRRWETVDMLVLIGVFGLAAALLSPLALRRWGRDRAVACPATIRIGAPQPRRVRTAPRLSRGTARGYPLPAVQVRAESGGPASAGAEILSFRGRRPG